MRNNGIFVILVLAFVITISAIGDEESLFTPAVDLAVEPVAVAVEPTMTTAARNNDFLNFDKLYRSANARDVAAWRELHRFWTWSMTDPVGGFYDQATHDQFARAYPDYAKFIEDYRIVDGNGNAFYPSAETRVFLLRHVGEAPLRIAAVPERRSRPSGQARVPVARPEPQVVNVPQPEPQSVITITPVTVPVEQARRIESPAPAPIPAPAPRHDVGRGIFLIIVGLIGIGVLTVMLHVPGEEPHSTHP